MAADTREKILNAAFTVLSRQGYENTSIKEIAEEARVAQGLVHYYFKTKQLLVLEVLAFVCQKVELGVEGEAAVREGLRHTKTMLKKTPGTTPPYIPLIGVCPPDPRNAAATIAAFTPATAPIRSNA